MVDSCDTPEKGATAEEGMSNRPMWCPDSVCTCLGNTGCFEGDDYLEGRTVFCVGRRDEPSIVVCDGITHQNDHNFCLWTGAKGWVRLLVNKADAQMITNLMACILERGESADTPTPPADREG